MIRLLLEIKKLIPCLVLDSLLIKLIDLNKQQKNTLFLIVEKDLNIIMNLLMTITLECIPISWDTTKPIFLHLLHKWYLN
jgi:hypothetical protein